MTIVDQAKEIAQLVKKYDDQDLNDRIFKLREEILKLCEKNLEFREQETIPKSDGQYNAGQSGSILKTSMANTQRQCILDALAKSNGKIAPAAQLLGISRPTLYEKIERFGIATFSDSKTKLRAKIKARLASEIQNKAKPDSGASSNTSVDGAKFWYNRAIVLCRAGLLSDAQLAIGMCFEINPDLKIAALNDPNLAALFPKKPN